MRMPWTGWVERRVGEALRVAAPEIARAAVEEAAPGIREAAKVETVQEIARVMSNQGGARPDLMPMVPTSYPQVGGAPHPLYGYDRPIWYSTPNSPRRKPDSVVSIDTIRQFASTYDILRACIIHLKREVGSQKFRVAARDGSDKSGATKARVLEATQFFTKRGGLGEITESRRVYEGKIFEDLLVVGAMAVWKNKTRGGRLLQALPIDAATIRPRMDAYGWPGPDDDWYEQWIMGMLITRFRPDELVYDGLYPETYSPWFKSPVEYLISTTLSALKADEWNRTWLTDGNTPADMIALPKEWTPDQVLTFADYFDAMLAGNTKGRQKTKFVPSGSEKVGANSRKDQEFAEFELWLMRRTCAIMGVQPASIGFAGEQYKVSQDGSMDSTSQFGAGALVDFRKEHYDDLLVDLGYEDLEVVDGETAEESPSERTSRLAAAIESGQLTVNEARKEAGQDPHPEGDVLLVSSSLKALGEAETDGLADEDPENAGDGVATEDLGRWMRKCLNLIKRGKLPYCSFESAHIDAGTREEILHRLTEVGDAPAVQSLFRMARTGFRN